MAVSSAQIIADMSELPDFVDAPVISMSYIEHLLDVLQARGCSRQALITVLGKDPAELAGSNMRASARDFAVLLKYAQQQGKSAGIGYALGMEIKPTSHGFLGMAVMSSQTSKQAVRLAERFAVLITGHLGVRLVEEEDTAIICIEYSSDFPMLRQFVLEAVSCVIIRTSAFLLGKNSTETEIWMDYPEPDYFPAWREQLPPVRFSMPANQIRFPVNHLEAPLVLASPASVRAAVEQLEKELALTEPAGDMKGRIRAALELSQHDFPSLNEVAEQLHISASTLKRRLHKEGSAFQALLDEVRRKRAIRYLGSTGMSVEGVAHALGYADPANFSRAFRKWTGYSPAAWRQQRESD